MALATFPAARSWARPACFGGTPEVIASQQPAPRIVGVTGGALYWVAGVGLRRLQLGRAKESPAAIDTDPVQFQRIGAIDRGQIFGVDGAERLVAYDMRTRVPRTLAAGKLSAQEAPVMLERSLQVDARYAYYWQEGPSGAVMPVPAGSETGLFRVRRDGIGAPELHVGTGRPSWAVDDGFVYLLGRDGVMRRPLRQGAAPEPFAVLPPPRERWFIAPLIKVMGGRVYFSRTDGIWSAPLDRRTPPVRHVEGGPFGVIDLLAADQCLYWADERRIYRLALDGGAPATAEVIADERTFQLTASPAEAGPRNSGPDVFDRRLLATDGHFLYWADMPGRRILRVGRDARPQPPPPLSVATQIGNAAALDLPAPDGSSWDDACGVHRACAQPTPALPVCAGDLTAVPWAELEAKADALADKPVSVRGPLSLGWLRRGPGSKSIPSRGMVARRAECAPGECCRRDPVAIAVGGGRDELELGSLACAGDDSRRCCNAPAFGQSVIASGVLARTRDHRWMLKSPRVCAQPGAP